MTSSTKQTLTFTDEYGKPMVLSYDVWFKDGKFHSVVNSLGFTCESTSEVHATFAKQYA